MVPAGEADNEEGGSDDRADGIREHHDAAIDNEKPEEPWRPIPAAEYRYQEKDEADEAKDRAGRRGAKDDLHGCRKLPGVVDATGAKRLKGAHRARNRAKHAYHRPQLQHGSGKSQGFAGAVGWRLAHWGGGSE